VIRPPRPADEAARLAALGEYVILDTQPERDFDAIARLAASMCHAPVSIVGFIDAERHWFKATVGVGNLRVNSRDLSFCGHAITQRTELFVVPDTLEDERFADNPLVAQAPHVRFYAGVPLVSPEGCAVGTLCILDVVPRGLDDAEREALTQLGRQVQVLLTLRRTISRLRIFESAVAFASDGILITAAANPANTLPPNIVFANDTFARITGYERDELEGQSAVLLEGPKTEAHVSQTMLAAVARPERSTQEVTHYRKNGEAFAAEVSLGPVLDAHGTCTHWVLIERDITERKIAQAAAIRTRVLEAANEALTSEIEQRRKAEDRLTFAALHDGLTGLANRAFFVQRLEQRLARARDSGRYDSAVLFVDLDRFKRVNDSFGHLIGDELLTIVGKRLAASLRPSDTLARFGGDEFTVLVEPIADVGSAAQVAERLSKVLEAPFKVCGREAFVRASIGITMIDGSYANADDVLRDADTAMYRAKESGRDRYQVFHADLRERALRVAELETDIHWALERKEFALVYQPIVTLDDGRIAGFEALVRWRHPQRGIISPAEFIPIVEETGLIVALGERIFSEACRQLRIWQDRFTYDPPLTMSINVSARQLATGNFATYVERTIAETGIAAERLNVELTESALMQDVEGSLECLGQLRKLGLKLHIDDFGTGYSSLSYLRQLRVDCLKIDRSFVSGKAGAELTDREISDTIISLGRRLGIETIAEGVETGEQRRELVALNCRYGQGYLFSRPLEITAAQDYLGRAFEGHRV